jgi:hypothetical protein
MSTDRILTELKIRLNSSLSCTQVNDFFFSKTDLVKLIHPSKKYCIKAQRII